MQLPRKRGEKPPQPLDFGLLTDFDRALDDWTPWHRSGYTVLAQAGGWRDQPAGWVQNVTTVEAVFNEEFEKLSKEVSRQGR